MSFQEHCMVQQPIFEKKKKRKCKDLKIRTARTNIGRLGRTRSDY